MEKNHVHILIKLSTRRWRVINSITGFFIPMESAPGIRQQEGWVAPTASLDGRCRG